MLLPLMQINRSVFSVIVNNSIKTVVSIILELKFCSTNVLNALNGISGNACSLCTATAPGHISITTIRGLSICTSSIKTLEIKVGNQIEVRELACGIWRVSKLQNLEKAFE